LVSAAVLIGCASKKRKGGKPSALSKFYHNTTALYNGYFNANELLEDSYRTLKQSHRDNYNEILSLYDYVSVENTKVVAADLDKAIEKVTTVAALHKPSKWVDDCYVLMGEAQYLKKDYETAEETFAYFKEEFNPTNPFGRNYQKKKRSRKEIKKEREKEREAEKKAREKKKEEEKEAKERAREQKEKEREAREKAKKEERERRKKEREAEKKAREKKKKRRKKKGKKRRPKKRDDKPKEETEKVEEKTGGSDTKPLEKEEVKETEDEKIVNKTPATTDETEDDEETYTYDAKKKKKKKIKKDNTAYSKGMMWYAKTLVQRDKYSTASYLVKRLRADGKMPEDALREVPVILADINIKEKNYYSALENLEEAIELADDKSLKARYAFVMGQLHVINGEYQDASEAFTKAKKWARSFEMEFMAELNAEKTQMMGGGKTNELVIAKLDKMIKEAKYADYLDQLYFTKGEIQLEAENLKGALQSFSLSIKNNVNNIALKQETYYKLAFLFYDKEKYVEAKNYFDSTVQVLAKEDPRFNECSRYAENLASIATNIEVIRLQDSLLNMTTWTDAQIETVAEKMIEDGKADLADKPATTTRKSRGLIGGMRNSLKKSSFFAYDKMSRERGMKRFEDTWGNIPLEDNWRRRDKSGIFDAGDEIVDEGVPEDGFEEDKISKMIDQIKSQIPYSDEAKEEIYRELEVAFFELGKAYRDKIQAYDKAANTHETLMTRFPDFENKLDVYYYLYLNYLELNNTTKAEYYKNKILTDFGDTEYAKAISDPNFGKNNLSEEEKLNIFYEETYNLFESGNYAAAYKKAKQAEENFDKKNPLRAKFALVKAMSTGSVEGKEAYIAALRDVTIKFPNTPEKARADEILRFLKGDKEAFTGIDMEEVDEIFSEEDDKLHYVTVVLYNVTPNQVVNTKIKISNYNKQYHKLKKLQLSETTLDRKKRNEIVLVRKFENKSKAMDYYNEVIKSQKEFVGEDLEGYAIYAVSQRNFRKMIIEKGDARYRAFFEKYYLNK